MCLQVPNVNLVYVYTRRIEIYINAPFLNDFSYIQFSNNTYPFPLSLPPVNIHYIQSPNEDFTIKPI